MSRIAWSFLLGTALAVGGAAVQAQAQDAPTSLEQALQALEASHLAMDQGGMRSQAGTLRTLAGDLRPHVQAGQVPQGLVDRVAELARGFDSFITMYEGVNNQARVDLLRTEQARLTGVAEFLQTVAQQAAVPAAGMTGGAVGELAIRIRLDDPNRPLPAQQRRPTPAQPPRPRPGAGGMGGGFGPGMGGGPEMGGGFGPEMGGGPSMGGPGMGGGFGPDMGGPGAMGGATGGRLLVISLPSVNQEFTTSGQLSRYLNENASELVDAAVVFHVAPDVNWQYVQDVAQVVASAPLRGPMSIAGLDLRTPQAAPAGQAPAERVPDPWDAPPAQTSAAPATREAPEDLSWPPPADAVEAPQPQMGPEMGPDMGPGMGGAMAMTPVVSPPARLRLSTDGRLPQAMEAMVRNRKSVLIAIDARTEVFDPLAELVVRQVQTMGADARFSIVAVNASGRAVEVLPWTQAGDAGAQAASQALRTHAAPTRSGLVTLADQIGRFLPDIDAVVMILEGPGIERNPGLQRLQDRLDAAPDRVPQSYVIVGTLSTEVSDMFGAMPRITGGAFSHLSARHLAELTAQR